MTFKNIYFILTLSIYFGNSEEVQPRIFNGNPVQTDEHKHLVKIFGASLCSGSIIGPTWVLTAGHCVYGVNNRQVFHHSQPTKHIALIYGSYPHPQFHMDPEARILDPHYVNIDIALVKTSPIQFNQYIQPISLLTQSPKVNEVATIAGYGLSNRGIVKSIPLQGKVRISKCPVGYEGTSVICTYGKVGYGPGDSGGPLATTEGLAGVNSASPCVLFWGILPCLSVAANVADKLNWINSVMNTTK